MNRFRRALLASLLLFSVGSSQAENMIMQRVAHGFEDTMIMVKEKLNEYGYRIAHIQKCDGGLGDFGYKTDQYRSVFYGKLEEVRGLTERHPEIIPYVPLKIAVVRENDTVVLVALNPVILSEFFPDEELSIQFSRWESDIRAIFDEIKRTAKL
jgi:uncharacterized protein (DUF302 family)